MLRISSVAAVLLLPTALLAQEEVEPAADRAAPEDAEAKIAEATLAAPPSITEGATFRDWEGNVLHEGSNGYTCLPSPPGQQNASMCLDEPWLAWAQAWQNRESVEIDRVGIGYMLRGDAGASNTDPYATEDTPDNEWVESGPHLMMIVPETSQLEGIPTDPENGGPWVMWKGTPYAHIMVPTGEQPTR